MSRSAEGIEFVQTEGIAKMFGPTRALTEVNLRMDAGKVTAIVGANGSGKSTLLNIVAGLMRPTRGQVRYADAPIRRSTLRRQIGVLAHQAMVYPDLTARENLHLYARLYGLENARSEVDAVCERFGVGDFGARPVQTYSRGQLQRLSLARALLHTPKLLLLDEPSTGLDGESKERLEAAILEERDRGTIVGLITHSNAMAQRVSDKVVELKAGKVVA